MRHQFLGRPKISGPKPIFVAFLSKLFSVKIFRGILVGGGQGILGVVSVPKVRLPDPTAASVATGLQSTTVDEPSVVRSCNHPPPVRRVPTL